MRYFFIFVLLTAFVSASNSFAGKLSWLKLLLKQGSETTVSSTPTISKRAKSIQKILGDDTGILLALLEKTPSLKDTNYSEDQIYWAIRLVADKTTQNLMELELAGNSYQLERANYYYAKALLLHRKTAIEHLVRNNAATESFGFNYPFMIKKNDLVTGAITENWSRRNSREVLSILNDMFSILDENPPQETSFVPDIFKALETAIENHVIPCDPQFDLSGRDQSASLSFPLCYRQVEISSFTIELDLAEFAMRMEKIGLISGRGYTFGNSNSPANLKEWVSILSLRVDSPARATGAMVAFAVQDYLIENKKTK